MQDVLKACYCFLHLHPFLITNTVLQIFLPTDTEKGIFWQICRGRLNFQSEPWPQISDSAKDLIRKMLDRNPRTRFTAHQVLCKSKLSYIASILFVRILENLFEWGWKLWHWSVFSVSGHPWIVDDNIAPDKPLDSAVLSRLKQFSAMNKLKKMALHVRLLWTFFLGLMIEQFYILVIHNCILLDWKCNYLHFSTI